MSQFPTQLDSDSDLPRVDNNITEIGSDAINAVRDAMFAVEAEIGTDIGGIAGTGASGSMGSIAARLAVSINPDGTIKPAILTGLLTLVTISDAQVSATAAIKESKLALAFTTTSLYNMINILTNSVDILNGFLSLTGIKLEPHIDGTAYNHELSAILVDPTTEMLKTNPAPGVESPGTSTINRNTTNADTLIKDISDDLITHEKADGSIGITAEAGGTVPPQDFAHVAAGVFIDTSSFSTIPQTDNSVQAFAEFVDNSSLLLLGTRVQTLYSNGVPRSARSQSLISDGYGEAVVPITPVTAYLLGAPPVIGSAPVDSYLDGDDVILFQPTTSQLSTFNFDAQFAQVRNGDLLTIDYNNGIAVQYKVDSIKSIISGSIRTYAVRINGKNLYATLDGYASARIDRSLFHTNKQGVLAAARSPNVIGAYESLIIANPNSASVIGNKFIPTELDSKHYNLYLVIYPTGDPTNSTQLPAIDITGNNGATPGAYTLDSLVNNFNIAARQPGFNYRFIAFEYNGQLGIMLADPYNNAAFSIISGPVDTTGTYTLISPFAANVVDNYNLIDPLGLGLLGTNVASPPPALSYSSVHAAALAPTLLFFPLRSNFYYANGIERDSLKSDPITINQIQDSFGDGYWPATIISSHVLPNRVEVTYQINLDLATSGLAIGKTLVVQPAFPTTDARYNYRDYGRFTISNLVITGQCNIPPIQTTITVYDGVYAAGISPTVVSNGIPVFIYFSDDSVSFDAENVFDNSTLGQFKRFFEIYTDQNGHTFTHERARFLEAGIDIETINMYRVSPQMVGYPTSGNISIRLHILSYDGVSGIYDGYLARFISPSTLTNLGPLTTGKRGEIVRFYDETNIDYIDFIFDINTSLTTFTNKNIDIQLFRSLELDDEDFLIASCQIDDSTKAVSYLKDERQFGNTSEKNFTSSAIDFINASDKLLRENGIIAGFDLKNPNTIGTVNLTNTNTFYINGGTALINGKIVNINDTSVNIPIVNEIFASNVITTNYWFLCANDGGELVFIASTDFDPLGSTATLYSAASLDYNRIFYVQNPNNTLIPPYPIRATYLANLVSTMKDLTPLCWISATTGTVGSTIGITSATVTDLRRFVSNGFNDLNDPLVLGINANFRNFISLFGWINNLTKFASAKVNNIGTKVKVKGNWTIDSTTPIFDFVKEIIFEGDGGTFSSSLTDGNAIMLGSNIHFKNMTFDYLYSPIINSDILYSSSNLANSGRGLIYINVNSVTGNVNITIDNCLFISNLTDRFPFITVSFSATGCIAENIKITNNRFETTADGVLIGAWTGAVFGEDKLAVMVFEAPPSAPFSGITEGARLINCTIDNNSCNKNQLIQISGTLDTNGSSPTYGQIIDMIATVGCRITRNVCGAINFLVKRDLPTDPAGFPIPNANAASTNGNYVSLDKMNGLIIADNNCIYIYSGNDQGFIWNDILSPNGRIIETNTISIGLFTGPVWIIRNTCAWIHTGVRIPSSLASPLTAPLIIKDNILNAYDPLFLNSYYSSGATSSVSPNISNTAIIVDEIKGS